jgi:hypothetical protein
MNKKRASEELRQWAFTRMHMGQQLKKHYQACMTEELPPRLLALVKKLDEDPQGCLSAGANRISSH